ncbi:hypothetical protein [Fructilactobacillus fructivorans]|uniref:Uncharacterized protein n=1 Tax=Fructilactobacillus fructivorans TaxID=1614 RepID=A0AAE6NZL8_9LACO|nr:hypothetical protein [Fructilactobacillus fructivorans]KRK57149.1 hypothetical protein FC73_GL001187 [Fructilactobacillus fructivorans]KRN12139.1 hypothetical protein IV37_GL001366 [Fructilactobacillus fructivorans]KRN40393.1 hypothetical protein IV51_GL000099 [Fructilactobacillus fructivorans]KRN42736.1 hypothetical protein IV48_GL001142 [Fructilactobacillus fructivorans]QFX92361.1 hypothetical protein LF543_01680 [Fructilactobacillus fructivorans]
MEDNIQLGEKPFDKMMFVLKNPVTEKNHLDYKFKEYEMQQIADDIWAMPAYMKKDDDFTIFFIVTKVDSGEVVVAMAEGQSGKNGQFDLSRPINTGAGLNALNKHDQRQALEALHFLNLISKAGEGEWRMVED